MSDFNDRLDPARFLADLAGTLHVQTGLEQTARIVALAVPMLVSDAVGSVALATRRQLVPAAAGSPALELAEQAQVELDEGPAVDVLKGASAVLVPDLLVESPWPQWTPTAIDAGWRSWLSLQLTSGTGQLIGVLSLASPAADAFDPGHTGWIKLLASHATVALDAARVRAHLAVAMDNHARIGHGLGILMERYGIDEEQAFVVLRKQAQDHGRKLRDVATELTRTGRLAEPDRRPN
ncbi:ANTAR domain protein with unknown sensor [Kribbella flavida DSM 17836]|uniref:ANTAR domain-containing protein n=1 Tax=Kribbella flavida (strain DSM 17836 / JCM 10339 / NBRC 14399) TaxID=479435 RepID=D2PPX2_KRIFD|nr:GAF and ANTAR domain-containing protein [Kribbella flavida]ADB32896.1 ANTAR domain protein with unknown sensor [Kribbella flavida DSM 17836]